MLAVLLLRQPVFQIGVLRKECIFGLFKQGLIDKPVNVSVSPAVAAAINLAEL